jgi:hypothetical protein
MQEDSGTVAHDFSDNDNDGAINNINLGSDGLLGTSSYGFIDSSTDAYVDTNRKFDFMQQTGDFTISFWMKLDSTDRQFVFDTATGSSSNNGIGIDMFNTGGYDDDIDVRLRYAENANVNASGVFNVGEWHHVAITMDDDGSTNGEFRLYVDSELKDTANTYTSSEAVNQNIELGHIDGSFGLSYGGEMSEFRIYNRGLSKSEVSRIYNVRSGYIETATKTFAAGVKPDISSTASLNGESISVEVIGSPGTASEESHTVALDGSGGPYSISWSSRHSEFLLNASLSSSDISETPVLNSLYLEGALASERSISGTVSDSSGSALNGIKIDAVNRSTGSVDETTSTNTTGGYQMGLPNGTYTVRAYDTGYTQDTRGVTLSGTNISGVDFNLNADPPALDENSASPDDVFVATSSTTLSIDVSDDQFGTLGSPGESVTVKFYDGFGNLLGTDMFTSSGTASVHTNTPSEWYAVATDSTGFSETSPTFEITAPPEIRIYNESSDQLIGTDVELSIESLDSSYSINQTIVGGTGNLSLPGEERLHVTATASGYVDRDFILSNYTRDYPLVMLPATDSDTVRYEQCYRLVDNVGNYPPEDSLLVVQTEVNSTQTQYKGMVSSGYFTSENLHCAFLVDQKPYHLMVQNEDGDAHRFGDWIARDDGTTESLTIGPASQVRTTPDQELEKPRYWSSKLDKQDKEIISEYSDLNSETDKLEYTIVYENENGNKTIIDNEIVQGNFGTYKDTTTVTRTEGTYTISWKAYNNTNLLSNGTTHTGGLREPDPPVPDLWLNIISIVVIVALGGLLVPTLPKVSALAMVASGALLSALGWLTMPMWGLVPAGIVALLFVIGADRGRM